MITDITLIDKNNEFVAAAKMIKTTSSHEVVQYGERYFLFESGTTYKEIFIMVVFTEEEYKFMTEEGIIT